ncbi:MAG TPA: ORF6N domain-containing protein, partial [Bacteroidales bacterium]|nr:ORF6N domain-containing protein [Bacteroidales bacterium]HPS26581.1 ORF6N domain-containing protein [Bacteroidales bacterium]
MMEGKQILPAKNIQERIFNIRGVQVILDSDLAEMYQVETRILNQAVKRNPERFPNDFMFQLTKNEFNNLLISQFVISSSEHGGRRKLPFVFTEQGVSMLSSVLKSDAAVSVSLRIMRAFVEMRKFIIHNAAIFQRIENVEKKQLQSDLKIDKILNALEDKSLKPKQGIFFDGQIFDAYSFVADLIKSAKQRIVLIDN